MAGGLPVLLITANVGSIFEEPSVMLKIWTEEFLSTISRLDPKFIALHCQEVGGKNYEQSMKHVEYFVRLLMSSEELRLFDKVRVFLDEDYSSAEHFTALGNFYFVHESVKDVLLWDFKECVFVSANGKEVHSGNIEAVTTKEKAKFPQNFFPECKWSRKGFLRTRWSISGTVFDLINIHLFHDASNFIAMEMFPSVYSKTRRRALEYTLDKFHNDQYPNVPYFLFGDFNFRTDTAGVIKKLTENTHESKLPGKGNMSRLQFHNKEDSLILTLGKKEFSHYEHQHVFIKNSGQWLREFDRELEDFDGRLLEFPIKFVPSYPFEEDIAEGSNYMKTRVPAWCDRVLLSPTAKALVQNVPDVAEYGIIGPMTCMGDHKPVYLRAVLTSDAGTINCCNLPNAYAFCFKVPDNYVDALSMLPDYPIDDNVQTISVDRSSNLLHAAPIKHDPYTPDSMDSPSPNAIANSGEAPDVDLDNLYGSAEATSILQDEQTSYVSKRIDRTVSPALLKSKLELIVRSKKQDSLDSTFGSTDIRRGPDEHHHIHSWSDADSHKGVRKSPSNSDVSWQRSHVLTQAWLEGKGQQGYHSFNTFIRQSSSNSSPAERYEDLPSDLIIPRIAIINASNFESCDSSVHLQDDRLTGHSENRLNSFSESRTRTISGEGSSLDRSDEICNKVDEEGEQLSSDMEERIKILQTALIQNTHKCISNKEIYSMEINSIEPIKDIIYKDEEINVKGSDNKLLENMYKEQNRNEYIDNQNVSKDVEKEDRKLEKSYSIDTDFKEKFERGEQAIEQFPIMPRELKENHSKTFVIKLKDTSKQYVKASKNPKSTELQEYDGNVISESLNTYVCNLAINENLRLDSRQEMLSSKNTTRSNSIQSQDSNENGGNVKLKLKACNVTKRHKSDVVSRKGKCQKCCCVVS